MILELYLVLNLVELTGPEKQIITINPETVVTLRAPRNKGHLDNDVKCIIHTSDGKFVSVIEECDVVRERLGHK